MTNDNWNTYEENTEMKRAGREENALDKTIFKEKYLTDSFFFIKNEKQASQLQEIAIEMGCLCHTGKPEIIEWHEGFKNLMFWAKGEKTFFQKISFFLPGSSYGDPVSWESFMDDYNRITP